MIAKWDPLFINVSFSLVEETKEHTWDTRTHKHVHAQNLCSQTYLIAVVMLKKTLADC